MAAIITIIDYGAGNLRSVVNAVNYLGYQTRVTDKPDDLQQANSIILPGVGSARRLMDGLKIRELGAPLLDYLSLGKPFLGICLGLQVLFEDTEEDGIKCLGLLEGRVRRLPLEVKIPHIGWNTVSLRGDHPCLSGIKDGSYFYFVHSYYAELQDTRLVLGLTDYGARFPAIIAKGKLIATQFHPEKSGEEGLHFLRNFFEECL
jgi:imidazole glycerol phosphate synthase glutamine amidotransferase subunit